MTWINDRLLFFYNINLLVANGQKNSAVGLERLKTVIEKNVSNDINTV